MAATAMRFHAAEHAVGLVGGIIDAHWAVGLHHIGGFPKAAIGLDAGQE
jgi:hypothetical protein